MVAGKPHFLLLCGSAPAASANNSTYALPGRWHFVLESLDSETRLEVADVEKETSHDRLALLALVRGLEALEQPSRVTLLTGNRYVSRGLRFGLNEWRENDFKWEHFGAQRPVRNVDLWRRVDQALRFHDVTCRLMPAAALAAGELDAAAATPVEAMAGTTVAGYPGERLPSPQVDEGGSWVDSIRGLGEWIGGKSQQSTKKKEWQLASSGAA